MGERDAGRIAVVGMAVRVPGAEGDLDRFWHNIANGVDSISHFTPDELVEWGVAPDLVTRPNFVPARGVLEDAFRFDAELFGYSPDESALIDPQQRLLLSCAWTALEHAGYPPVAANGNRIGVYVGTGMNVYLFDNVLRYRPTVADAAGLQLVIGGDKDFAATRIAYKLNLQGPGITLQSACSTSLVAVHTAVQSLLTYETDLALAGGASVAPPSRRGYLYEPDGFLSPDGRCRTFDAAAQGTVPGDGVGVVVLKRLEDARRDGDTVHAVIAGSAVNNDGSRKAGFTAPGPAGQAAAVAAALAVAGVDPDGVGVIETHGTATPLGDPVEVAGLLEVFGIGRPDGRRCALTAVKSNIGHLDTAGGVVALIKMVLALKHRIVPPVAHFKTANVHLGLERTPFYVPERAEPWEPIDGTRRAGVSAFGVGGTNAHVVLEEAAPSPAGTDPGVPRVLMVSARSERALRDRLRDLASHLDREPPGALDEALDGEPAGVLAAGLADVAYTLRAGRTPMPWRAAFVAADVRAAVAASRRAQGRRQLDERRRGHGVVFVFGERRSWTPGTGRSCHAADPVYRATIDEAANRLASMSTMDPYAALLDGPVGSESPRLATVVAGVARARGLLSRGIHPRAVLGDGAGEIAAACVAGALTLAEAIDLVASGRPPTAPRHTGIPVYSTRAAGPLDDAQACDSRYWRARLDDAASGSAPTTMALDGLAALDPAAWIVIGPGDPLPGRSVGDTPVVRLDPRDVGPGGPDGYTALLTAVATLWQLGIGDTWDGVHDAGRRRIPLPTYPFATTRYLIKE